MAGDIEVEVEEGMVGWQLSIRRRDLLDANSISWLYEERDST